MIREYSTADLAQNITALSSGLYNKFDACSLAIRLTFHHDLLINLLHGRSYHAKSAMADRKVRLRAIDYSVSISPYTG